MVRSKVVLVVSEDQRRILDAMVHRADGSTVGRRARIVLACPTGHDGGPEAAHVAGPRSS